MIILLKVNICFHFLVSDTIAGESPFYAGSCLPTSDGALCVHDYSFYRLTCTTTACSWSKMSKQFENFMHSPTLMYLPKEYFCQGGSLFNFSFYWNLLNVTLLSYHSKFLGTEKQMIIRDWNVFTDTGTIFLFTSYCLT